MKKVISILLSVIIVASSVFGASFAYANGTATDKLEEIQNMPGFVPGENSIIQRNCYGFVSEVCKKLYGVPYAEGLYNNYQVKHNSGNFTTSDTFTSKKQFPMRNLLKMLSISLLQMQLRAILCTMVRSTTLQEKLTLLLFSILIQQ